MASGFSFSQENSVPIFSTGANIEMPWDIPYSYWSMESFWIIRTSLLLLVMLLVFHCICLYTEVSYYYANDIWICLPYIAESFWFNFQFQELLMICLDVLNFELIDLKKVVNYSTIVSFLEMHWWRPGILLWSVSVEYRLSFRCYFLSLVTKYKLIGN